MKTTTALAAILAALSGCMTPPGAPPGFGASEADPTRDLIDDIRAQPGRIHLYPRLIELQLGAGDLLGARESGEFCADHNSGDYRAWLIKAQVERALIDLAPSLPAPPNRPSDFAPPSFAKVEEALLRASRLEPTKADINRALAGFYAETWRDDEEERRRRSLLDNVTRDETDGVRLELASLALRQGRLDAAREWLDAVEAEPVSESVADRAWALRLRLNLSEGAMKGAAAAATALAASEPGGDALLWHQALLRVLPLLDDTGLDRAAGRFQEALAAHEQPELRFACLLGLWEIGWLREARRDMPGTPPDHAPLSARIEQIDADHPDWLTRASLACAAVGDREGAEAYATRAGAAGLAVPPPSDFEALRLTWLLEDAVALGVYPLALETANALLKRRPGDPLLRATTLRLRFRLLKQDHREEARALADEAERAAEFVGADRARELRLLRCQALLRGGAAQQANESIDAELARNDQGETTGSTMVGQLRRLRLLAAYHAGLGTSAVGTEVPPASR